MNPVPKHNKTRRRINAVSIAKLIKAMQENNYTVRELTELVGLHVYTVRSYVLTMHREGACHIAHWERDTMGRYQIAAYALGPGKDAKRPTLDAKERGRMYRQRVRQQKALFALAGV